MPDTTIETSDINSEERLEAWLKDKPVDWAQTIAVRTALRVFPLISQDAHFVDLTGRVVRALFISWAVRTCSTGDMIDAARSAAYSIRSAPYPADSVARAATYSVDTAANTEDSTKVAAYSARSTVYSTDDAVNYFTRRRFATVMRNSIWENVRSDVHWLRIRKNQLSDYATPNHIELWGQTGIPELLSQAWVDLRKKLLNTADHWHIWTDWYENLLDGKPGFDLPRDLLEEYVTEIATMPTEWWEAGERDGNASVNTHMAERLAYYLDLNPPLAGQLIAQASPDVTLTQDGTQLDAAPNPDIDTVADPAALEAILTRQRLIGEAFLQATAPKQGAETFRTYLDYYVTYLDPDSDVRAVKTMDQFFTMVEAEWHSPYSGWQEDGHNSNYQALEHNHGEILTCFPHYADARKTSEQIALPAEENIQADLIDPIESGIAALRDLTEEDRITPAFEREVTALENALEASRPGPNAPDEQATKRLKALAGRAYGFIGKTLNAAAGMADKSIKIIGGLEILRIAFEKLTQLFGG